MSGFGFSAGDFIAAIDLIHKVVAALNERKGASAEFRTLVQHLDSIEGSRQHVQHLQFDDAQESETIQLRRATTRCVDTIKTFYVNHLATYDRYLQAGGSGNSTLARVKDGMAKTAWAVLKKDDVVKFQSAL
ncbi:hypothetical protein BDV96DRAFT_644390 [Lophiotrema nucula]|uniref:Fungal N-terminal domain-containing protein n=1 Tax=Lophiotrema nucula TaxID=690887 RepID=A0A6A5ZI30_9PLEO|nr:hypothetical protein BDV96DRAFT_644390 [Lophiotrema nucula]